MNSLKLFSDSRIYGLKMMNINLQRISILSFEVCKQNNNRDLSIHESKRKKTAIPLLWYSIKKLSFIRNSIILIVVEKATSKQY